MERNLTRERTRSALAVKRANGQRIGGIPYGFDLSDDGATLTPLLVRPISAVFSRRREPGPLAKAFTTFLTQQDTAPTQQNTPTKIGA